jgi:hypothetical protein
LRVCFSSLGPLRHTPGISPGLGQSPTGHNDRRLAKPTPLWLSALRSRLGLRSPTQITLLPSHRCRTSKRRAFAAPPQRSRSLPRLGRRLQYLRPSRSLHPCLSPDFKSTFQYTVRGHTWPIPDCNFLEGNKLPKPPDCNWNGRGVQSHMCHLSL